MPAPRITEAVLRDAAAKGLGPRAVAAMTGCKEQSVRNVCAALGVKLINDGGTDRRHTTDHATANVLPDGLAPASEPKRARRRRAEAEG